MKILKFTIYLTLLSTLFLTSCSKDSDGDSVGSNSNLFGTWNLESFEYTGNTTNIIAGITTNSISTGIARDINANMKIDEEKMIFSGSYIVDLEIMSDFGNLNSVTPFEDFESINYYEKEGDLLTFTMVMSNGSVQDLSNQTTTMEIIEITSNSLTLLQKSNGETPSNSGGTAIHDVEGTLIFSK